MADRQFTWEAIIDNKGAIRSINELTDTLKRAFQQSGTKVELIDKASVEAAKASIRSATTEQVESQKRATIEARTQSSERVQLARNESALVAEAAKAASATKIEEERRTTALLRAELQERQRAITQSSTQSSPAPTGGSGLQNAVLGGIAGYFTVQGAQQIFNYAKEIAALDTSVSRASKAFEIMSGSANEAEKRLRAIQSASGGTVTELQAIQIANQATSLGLAKSSGEFEKLTRAARAVTFVSPVIHDVQSAISELALASSNLSFRRLDQLGLSVTEVKTRMSELKAMGSGLDDSQAFLKASVDALNSKFGALLNSTEAQAGGVERLTTAWSNFVADVATSRLGEFINNELTEAGIAIDRFNYKLTGNTKQLESVAHIDNIIGTLKKPVDTGIGPVDKVGNAAVGLLVDNSSRIADLERLKTMVADVDKLVADGVQNADEYQQKVYDFVGRVVAANGVTGDMAQEMGELQSSIALVSSSLDSSSQAGKYYAEAVSIAGSETVNTNDKTSQLVSKMSELTVQYNQNKISSSEYAAAINTLGGQLVGMAGQAATAAGALAAVNYQTSVFYAAANNKAFFASGGTVGTRPIGPLTRPEASSLATDTSINPFTVQAQEKSRNAYHKQLQDEQDKAAKEAMRAAKAGQKAFNTAAKEMNSMITGIVKVSEVTQQDMEDAKNGVYQNKPDEYLRQLRDEVKNKKDYKDVSIEDAAAGLNKIGIETAGKSAEVVLQLFEQAYSNMSLFADESNLKFINDAAVQYQIDLQEKSKQGQENIVRHFGGVVDGAVSAIVGGSGGASTGVAGGVSGAGVAPTINIDGKALAGDSVDISATITGLSVGKDVTYPDVKLTAHISELLLLADAKLPDITLPAGYIKEIGLFANVIYPNVSLPTGYIKEIGLFANVIYPDISLPKGYISEIGLFANVTYPDITLPTGYIKEIGLFADVTYPAITLPTGYIKEVGLFANVTYPSVTIPVAYVESVLLLASATLPSPKISVTIDTVLGDPTQQEIVAYQQRLDTLVKEKPAATLAGQGGLGNLLVRNGKETGEEKNPLAGDYIASLTDGFNTPENVLALATIGTGIRGAIDSGIRTAPTGDVGTEIIALINGQFFSEANVITIKSIGNNVFELIIAGIRLAMQKKNNNVGQEIVNTIAAQVVTATAEAISGE